MKKLLQILFIVQFILISCKKKSEKKADKKEVIIEKSFTKEENKIIENKPKVDTTEIRKYAEAILNNEIYPSDNDQTFECIKQMFTKDKNDLEFYFKVFRVIVEKSDGALSEAIGLEIMNFLKFNPDFFIEQYSEFKLDEKQKFIGFMAYEFYFTEPEHNAEINQYFSEVNLNLEQSTEPKRKYLNSIKELTKIETEKIINE
ncbi:hypothetical protein ACFQ1R_12995 [Mariniflexile jejuense]|uniref:Lipoprotein n=1 Tax=Mariniflexile jejuense TaxID=1173582 RepID=A0ABW3JKJ2_9FLAO